MKKRHSLHTLNNGLRVVLSPQEGTQAVTVLALYKIGSRHEPASMNGAAHFIEHLMFKGSRKWPDPTSMSKILDGLGAEYNAFTGKDMTGYYIKLAANKVEVALEILADMLIHPLAPKKEMERERGVIIEEINMYEDNPRAIVGDLAERLVYQGHPLAREIIGTKKIIRGVNRSELLKFRSRYYTNERAVVSIAGKINQGKVLQICEKYFNSHSRNKSEIVNHKFNTIQNGARLKIKEKKTEQVHLALGLPALAENDERMPVLKVLTALLGVGMSSRLFIELREKRGLCYSVGALTDTFEDTGSFMVRAGLDKSRIKPAIELILKELKKLKRETVSAKELRKTKDFIHGSTILSLEESEQVASALAREVLYRGKAIGPLQRLRKIERVTSSQIKKLAQELFTAERLNLAIIGPFSHSAKGQFKELLKI